MTIKKDSLIDSGLCTLFRLTGPLIRLLPKNFSLAFGRTAGTLVYYLDVKHRAVAYANIKTAFGDSASPSELAAMTRRFYRTFGENLMEIFFIPQVNKGYLERYIEIVGREHVDAAFKKGKGVILLALHEGSWELSNIICAHLAFPFNFFVRDQRYPRLDSILNLYRFQQGCRVIHRGNQVRRLVEVLMRNEAIGITADQGGKRGILVKFFGREASMSIGAVKMALKSGATVIPCFYVRLNGPYIRVIFEPPYELEVTGDKEVDVRANLQGLVKRFEKYVGEHSKEYLWTYKIWKYGRDRRALIISDGKAGHLRQSEAAIEMLRASLAERNNILEVDTVEVKFKNRLSRHLLGLSGCLAGKYSCQGCLRCLKACLDKDVYERLIKQKYEFIVSCGSALAPVNYLLSRENQAKSVAIMKPGFMSTRKFDLVIMPRHDRPPKAGNVTLTRGSVNSVDAKFLSKQAQQLKERGGLELPRGSGPTLGLFIGGDAGDFRLDVRLMERIIRQLKQVAGELEAGILVTTSRRTPPAVEDLIESEFAKEPRCKLAVIANRKNIPEAAGGILGLSDIVLVSSESISMVSEAAGSKKYVFVFGNDGIGRRHRRFLRYLTDNKYIYPIDADSLSAAVRRVWISKPAVKCLDDAEKVKKAVGLLI